MGEFIQTMMDMAANVRVMQIRNKQKTIFETIVSAAGLLLIGCAMIEIEHRTRDLENTVRKLEMKEVP